MTDLNTITIEDFESCLGQTFQVTPDNADGLELELIQARSLAASASEAGVRQPFSVLFRGPLEPVMAQQLLRIENSTFGELHLFLVPIGPDESGMLYDVTFN